MSELTATIRLRRAEFQLDVELTCPPGITCVMGPSGSGKSTILQVLAGMYKPDVGRVCLGSECWLDIAKGVDVPVNERRLAYVFQSLALFPHMNALHNVQYALHGMPRHESHARATQLLAKLGVAHLAHRRPRTFSGGEAQRVALARAIAREPKLILLDEPFSALDADLRAQLTKLVRELVAELGVPLVHVTHSAAEARQLGDQVIRVSHGKVVAQGKAADVLAKLSSDEE